MVHYDHLCKDKYTSRKKMDICEKKMDLIIFYQDKQNIGYCFPNFQQLLNCFYYFFKKKYYEKKMKISAITMKPNVVTINYH